MSYLTPDGMGAGTPLVKVKHLRDVQPGIGSVNEVEVELKIQSPMVIKSRVPKSSD